MTDKKEEIIQNSGRIFLMVLFFFVAFSITGRSEKPTCNDDSRYEVITGLHSVTVKAILADFVRVPFYQKNLQTSMDVKGFLLFNYKFKITAENINTCRQFSSLRNILPLLKPQSACRFYYHLFHIDASDASVLS
jgi:hypothetical protein